MNTKVLGHPQTGAGTLDSCSPHRHGPGRIRGQCTRRFLSRLGTEGLGTMLLSSVS